MEELCSTLGRDLRRPRRGGEPGGANFEARARAERRRALPAGALTGHTMDDLAETVLLNMMRGAGVDGLSPMVNDPTKPLRDLRRSEAARRSSPHRDTLRATTSPTTTWPFAATAYVTSCCR